MPEKASEGSYGCALDVAGVEIWQAIVTSDWPNRLDIKLGRARSPDISGFDSA